MVTRKLPAKLQRKVRKSSARLLPVIDAVPATPVVSRACPVVGIGASAGGLEAFEAFFRVCPADTHMAFVLVPHLDPSHVSLLTEILQRSTGMQVLEAVDGLLVAPDHVYIIPPNRDMALLGGVLQVTIPEQARGQRMPIDTFLRSMADDQAAGAIGIILSGTATDGTQGLQAILAAGGVCMVQEPATAKYAGMPQSAIDAGCTTHILPVEKMPAMLLETLRQQPYRVRVPALMPPKNVSAIRQILLQLRSITGQDFSLYKKSTISRRIQRRMTQHNIESEAIYARYIRENPAEARLLIKELLINVTSFFRDAGAFKVLGESILPGLVAGKESGYSFRVWIPGCATGEEAYSIAILLAELQSELRTKHAQELNIQIYATDLDEDAINAARSGLYPPGIAQDITPERLTRFFSKTEAGYKVKKELRDMVVFAVQNVIKDPPFTRLDLLSCRNLMIYLETELQNRLIPSFHYALKPAGVLFLSTSESVTGQQALFSNIDRKWKFYRAVHIGAAPLRQTSTDWSETVHRGYAPTALKDDKTKVISLGNIASLSANALLRNYAPASVTTDSHGNIQHVHGDTGRYLRPAPGPVSNNVLEMARDGLQLVLRTALLNAGADAAPTVNHEVLVKTNGGYSTVHLSVRLLPKSPNSEQLLLISFDESVVAGLPGGKKDAASAGPARGKRASAVADVARVTELERELAYAKETLQASSEEQQASNEELKSTNEELQSTNEELQSSNEELETSKEELQSLNEETLTVNAELNAKIDQLNNIQNDMKNLLDSINTGTLFLDHDLIIRRYSPAATKAYRMILTDIGRPLTDIVSNLETDLQPDLQSVLDTLAPVEREVRSIDGAWYLARSQAYRTLDNVIEGVVLTFTDVSRFKLATESAEIARSQLAETRLVATQIAREFAEAIVDTVVEPLVVLDSELQVVSASHSFYKYFNVSMNETVGHKIYDLGNGQWNIVALRDVLDHILQKKGKLDDFVVEHVFPGIGWCRMVLNARPIATSFGAPKFILLAMTLSETSKTG